MALALLFLAMTFTLFAPIRASTAPPTTQENRTAEYMTPGRYDTVTQCFYQSPKLAKTRDCLYAVLLLPTYDDAGFFNSDQQSQPSKPNNKRLPHQVIFGSCNLTISIPEDYHIQCSWGTTLTMAGHLNQLCSVGPFPQGQSGGVTWVGDPKKIRISMGKVGTVLTGENSIGSIDTA